MEADSLDVVSADCENVNVVAEVQAALDPGRCQIYRRYYSPNVGDNEGEMKLRWGDKTFGYRHLTYKVQQGKREIRSSDHTV